MVVIGGGPGGYEAALVAASLDADVTIVDRDGLGGSCVLTDCVPSKALISVAEVMSLSTDSDDLGIEAVGTSPQRVLGVDVAGANRRIKRLARAQSADIRARLEREGVRVVAGAGRLDGPTRVAVELHEGGRDTLDADAVLVATGATARRLPGSEPDGERILDWTQLYDLEELPERLIVVGSGVTGAEFASAYDALGSEVTLVSSRDRVLPGEDADAAALLEEVFKRRGMQVITRVRGESVTRTGDGVRVTLSDGTAVEGSHCLLAVGSVPNTSGLGLEEAGVQLDHGGFIQVDKVSRTTARGVYAAGDCTGVLLLASVAAMQGRIAMWHALGEAVAPIDLKSVSSNVFTAPEIATVGWSETSAENSRVIKLPLATNARAKMLGLTDGFVKLIARRGSGTVVGGVVVAPRASELIHPISLAVKMRLSIDQVASAYTVYPSLSGSVAEAARQLHERAS